MHCHVLVLSSLSSTLGGFCRRPRPKYVTLCMATLHIACSNGDTEVGPDSRQVPINLNNCLCAFFSEQFYIENISLVHVS